jgi:hypothetical protein
MADTATAILHTPWDCQWSRFARRTADDGTRGGLWDCVRSGARVPISETDCGSCPFYEYNPPLGARIDRAKTCERAAAKERSARLPAPARVGDSVLLSSSAFTRHVVLDR